MVSVSIQLGIKGDLQMAHGGFIAGSLRTSLTYRRDIHPNWPDVVIRFYRKETSKFLLPFAAMMAALELFIWSYRWIKNESFFTGHITLFSLHQGPWRRKFAAASSQCRQAFPPETGFQSIHFSSCQRNSVAFVVLAVTFIKSWCEVWWGSNKNADDVGFRGHM